MHELEQRLAELEQLGLRRRLRLISGPQGPRVLLDGKPVLLLCSNNYLGLADHPRVRQAAAEAAMRWGVGAGASRLVSGSMTIHRRLEERLAAFKGTEGCVLFGSGYLANVGTIDALAGAGDVIFSDELNHASIVDGCRLSKARVVRYRHCDAGHLEWCLRNERGSGRRLIVSDSVFSMDADVAPLEELAELAEAYGARLMVDEAHATGVLGPGGRGAVAAAGLEGAVDVLVGTLGKALGSYGAYVCAQQTTVQYLINAARSFIFSTAPAPPAAAGALAALELVEARPHRVERLQQAGRVLREALAHEGFAVGGGEVPIVPLVVGDEHAAMRLCQAAIERGVFVQAIRPPSVPAGTTRLRLTAMASHTTGELRQAARVLAGLAARQGLDPAAIGTPAPRDEPGEEVAAQPLRVLAGLGARAATRAAADHEPRRADAGPAAWPEEAQPAQAERREPAGDGLPDTESFEVQELWSPAPPAGGEPGRAAPQAPFDLEREGGFREAA